MQPLPDPALAVIADFGTPTRLTKEEYPDAGKFSAKKIIDVLCGSYRKELWIATQRLNDGLAGLAVTDRVRERAYQIKWPACTYVIKNTPALSLTVYNKTNASDLYKELTGRAGDDKSIRYFFRQSKVAVRKYHPGAELIASHLTVASAVKIQDPDGFAPAIRSALPQKYTQYLQFQIAQGDASPTPPQAAPPPHHL